MLCLHFCFFLSQTRLDIDSTQAPTINISWGFRFAFGFDEEDGFFLYTFPDEESEFSIRADFDLPIETIDAKLLYFLNLALNDIQIKLGAGVFVDLDKQRAMRIGDNRDSVRYGRLSLSDLKQRVPVKKDVSCGKCLSHSCIKLYAFFFGS